MKYTNIRNGLVATVISTNDKTKTVSLEYDESGKTTDVTTSTLKRWWKPVKEEKEENMKDNDTKKAEVTNAIKQAVKEKAAKKNESKSPSNKGAQAKEKPVKKEGKKKASGIPMEEAHDIIKKYVKQAGFESFINEKNPKTVWILINGKKTSGVYVGGSKCVLGLPEKLVPKGYKADRTRNCPMSHSFDVPYSDMDRLVDILSKVDTIEQEEK